MKKHIPVVVLDSNIILSGLIWGGNPGKILEQIESSQLRLFTSRELLNEFRRIISYPKVTKALKDRHLVPRDLMVWLVSQAVLITPKPLDQTIIAEDPSDDAILACAVTAQADYIISGDKKHLLPLKTFRGIPIVSSSRFLEGKAVPRRGHR